MSTPRWKSILDAALAKNPGATIFQLASLQPTSPHTSPTTPVIPSTRPQPRVRSHVFRSFIDALPPTVHLPRLAVVKRGELSAHPLVAPSDRTGSGSGSPTGPGLSVTGDSEELEGEGATTEGAKRLRLSERVDSRVEVGFPLIVTTTDIRTPKVTQLLSHPHVEIVWWIDDGSTPNGPDPQPAPTKQQFRIAGTVSLVPSPQSSEVAAKLVFGGDEGGAAGNESSTEFWQSTRLTTFKSLSAHMKASWARPTPGTPLSLYGGHSAPNSWPETIEDPSEPSDDDPSDTPEDRKRKKEERDKKQKWWNEALRNFALVVIEPGEVDVVDLGVVPNRRWRFWREGGGWREEEVVA